MNLPINDYLFILLLQTLLRTLIVCSGAVIWIFAWISREKRWYSGWLTRNSHKSRQLTCTKINYAQRWLTVRYYEASRRHQLLSHPLTSTILARKISTRAANSAARRTPIEYFTRERAIREATWDDSATKAPRRTRMELSSAWSMTLFRVSPRQITSQSGVSLKHQSGLELTR